MTVNVTLTFPESVLKWIDRERGEIKRSSYVIRLLQQTRESKKQNLKKLPQGSHKVGAPQGFTCDSPVKITGCDKE